MNNREDYDACIVGAGPAGLNAALILGRCGRRVIVFDHGQPRNAASRGLHGYLTRDGVHPLELRRIGRDDVTKYPSVTLVDTEVATVHRHERHFDIVTVSGQTVHAQLLLLATGRVDVLPEQLGFREYYGRGVYHCPYCDGWEHRGQRITVHGDCPAVVDYALALLTWTKHVTLCASNPAALTAHDAARLRANGIGIALSRVRKLEGDDAALRRVCFEDGTTQACDAVFFTSALPQKSELAQSLGCKLDAGGSVVCQKHAATGVPGLYVAGNVRGGVHLAIMAAAEGAEAGIAMNEELADRELHGTPDGAPARNSTMEERPGAQIPEGAPNRNRKPDTGNRMDEPQTS